MKILPDLIINVIYRLPEEIKNKIVVILFKRACFMYLLLKRTVLYLEQKLLRLIYIEK